MGEQPIKCAQQRPHQLPDQSMQFPAAIGLQRLLQALKPRGRSLQVQAPQAISAWSTVMQGPEAPLLHEGCLKLQGSTLVPLPKIFLTCDS